MPFIFKTIVSAILIALIAELSRRNTLLGSLTASLPLVSVLSMVWLYNDTHNIDTVAQLSVSIFWMVLPSLALFLMLPFLLKKGFPFYPALGLACLGTSVIYSLAFLLYTKIGIKI